MFSPDDYYKKWLSAIILLREAHPILQNVLDSGFGNYNKEMFQEFLDAIEDVI